MESLRELRKNCVDAKLAEIVLLVYSVKSLLHSICFRTSLLQSHLTSKTATTCFYLGGYQWLASLIRIDVFQRLFTEGSPLLSSLHQRHLNYLLRSA